MPFHDPRAIANEFLARRNSDAWPKQLAIQKLCHIANGWNLVINGSRLTSSLPEAWDNGPVYREIWDHIRDFGYRGDKCELFDPSQNEPFRAELDDRERAVIDLVWGKYGQLPAHQLRELTHEPNSPWDKAYFGRGRNAELDESEIRRHYIELANAGRRATQ